MLHYMVIDWQEPEGTGTAPRPAEKGNGEQKDIDMGQQIAGPEKDEEEYTGPMLTYPSDDV